MTEPLDPLARFSAPVREWFSTSFPEPTGAQAQGWPAIAAGEHALILAPTGSGKTLAAFLWGLDLLITTPPPADKRRRTRLLYLSPLRALAVDVEKNLRAPLLGIELAAERLGEPFHAPTVGMRTGDTPADQRRRLVSHPPDLLITTPESLYLMLTSRARETLLGVEAVIIDEIHALASTKRGAHLALSLERLEHLINHPPADPKAPTALMAGTDRTARTDPPAPNRSAFQRIGLSATQRPLDEIARFLGGTATNDQGGRAPRPVRIVDAGVRKPLEIEVIVPVDDMSSLGETIEDPTGPSAGSGATRHSIWPSMHPRLLELVQEHRSTLIFVNARRLAERLATRLNELALEGENRAAEAEGRPPPPGTELVQAHHGSLSRERRLKIEDDLKAGRLKGLVATSSLELGIDMGAVDLVIQVESPGAVSRGLQRIGRAGHQVGEPSRGKIFPKHRNDLVEAAVVVERMREGLIEHTRYPRNPLDVLAQQIVAMAALDDWPIAELADVVRGAANFADLSDDVFHNVADLLAGRYPSDEFGELRPRVVWDRVNDVIRGRAGSQRLAVTSGGTIPDRGLFGVFLPDGTRVGELDEEMVYESRPGETFLLGASTWRIEDITHERVVVVPAPGEPGKMPFWHGDGPGRPLELGRALGRFVRELRALDPDDALARLGSVNRLDDLAARNLVQYLDEQAEATGAVPDDRTIVIERFRDEIGDWRICVLTPFGAQVHAPWAMALQARLNERLGLEVELMWSDDGIVLRLPDAVEHLPTDELLIDPHDIDEIIVTQLPSTAMFASRFRECAARALLLPRRRPDRRTPLWQQRQKAADLLAVAARYPDFPILLETTRECINDVFDLPALREVLTDLQSRRIRVVSVDTPQASPFARSLIFGWIAVYMYAGDAPLAERRAAALGLDRDLLRDLLGAEELRELIDPHVLDQLEAELQRLVDGRRARDADELHDLLRMLGPLTVGELARRVVVPTVRNSASDRAADNTARHVSAVVAAGGASDASNDGVDEATAVADRAENVADDAPNDLAGHDVDDARDDVGGEPVDVVFDREENVAADAVVAGWVDSLVAARRAFVGTIAGAPAVIASEDAARVRDGLGVSLPLGLPTAYTDPVAEPMLDLVSRYARTHGPFVTAEVAAHFGVVTERVLGPLERLEADGRIVRGEFRPAGIEREWCDQDVLRQIRRRSLAALRKEVEPVDTAALARFLPQWQGVGLPRRGLDALVETIGSLQGLALPASVLERDVLRARVAGYQPADLDALCTSGDVVWVGAGSLGARDGRVRLLFRDQAALLVNPAPTDDLEIPGDDAGEASHAGEGGGEVADDDDALRLRRAIHAHLRASGASFWPDLLAAAHEAGRPVDGPRIEAALWDLVWSGHVTNDSLTPLRALTGARSRSAGRGPSRRSAGRRPGAGRPNLIGSGLGRPSLSTISRAGPASAAGRWSLVAPLLTPAPSPTEAAHARALQLLERHGVLTREAALAEGVEGGFAGVYPVLKALEERGLVRRGYFVAGLGAAQFALPGAVDRLRSARASVEFSSATDDRGHGDGRDGFSSAADDRGYGDHRDDSAPDAVLVLAATDPAQPFGAALPWPASDGRPARVAGAYVVLIDGAPVAYLERGAASLATFETTAAHAHWPEGLTRLVKDGQLRKIEIRRIDGGSPSESPAADQLRQAGFTDGYKGLGFRL